MYLLFIILADIKSGDNMEPIEYLQNTQIVSLINNAPEFQKAERTGFRLPQVGELGQEFITYVKDCDTVRKESSDVVIARNPTLLGKDNSGKDIYNEWLVPKATVVKIYGQEVLDVLGTDFTQHKKKAIIKAVLLTKEVFDLAGIEGETFPIKVSLSPEPMIAKLGDYITSGGYSISAHDIKGYEMISAQNNVINKISDIRANATSQSTLKSVNPKM